MFIAQLSCSVLHSLGSSPQESAPAFAMAQAIRSVVKWKPGSPVALILMQPPAPFSKSYVQFIINF